METLTPRQSLILKLIIREYSENPKKSGIGSARLLDKYDLGVSSATVRNEMAELTKLGMLQQPHTSAGRVPTEEGYRYFVNRLVHDDDLTIDEERTVSHQFHQARMQVDQWSRLAASVLARHTQNAAIVTSLHSEEARFKHLELISTRGRQVLVVLVLQGGNVKQQMLMLSEPVDQVRLSRAATRLTEVCADLTARDIEALPLPDDRLEEEVIQIVSDVMFESNATSSGRIYRDGLENLLNDPTGSNTAEVRQTLQVITERSFLDDFLSQTLTPSIGSVQVLVAGEGDWHELSKNSLVISRYGIDNLATGALGVLGPTHMQYGRAIGIVRYVSDMLTNMVNEMYGEEE